MSLNAFVEQIAYISLFTQKKIPNRVKKCLVFNPYTGSAETRGLWLSFAD